MRGYNVVLQVVALEPGSGRDHWRQIIKCIWKEIMSSTFSVWYTDMLKHVLVDLAMLTYEPAKRMLRPCSIPGFWSTSRVPAPLRTLLLTSQLTGNTWWQPSRVPGHIPLHEPHKWVIVHFLCCYNVQQFCPHDVWSDIGYEKRHWRLKLCSPRMW